MSFPDPSPATDPRLEPDGHLDPEIAAHYDQTESASFSGAAIQPAVALLAELAAGGAAVEFAVGTGRLAIPLAAAGVKVFGIDFSGPMLAELRKKPGALDVVVTQGDMAHERVCQGANLVYLAFNTITNLRTQALQVACFRNAAAHLAPGGRFLVENGVPKLRQLEPGATKVVFAETPEYRGMDEYVDFVDQISLSHHQTLGGEGVRTESAAFRYVWPSELDLMAELAGMTLESRWSDWDRSPFTGDSMSHVSVWRKAPAP